MKVLFSISFFLLSLATLPVFADGGETCGPGSCRADWSVF